MAKKQPGLLETNLLGHIGRQHFGELVILETTSEELFFREAAVAVLVHAGKDVLGALLGRVGGLGGSSAQHVVDGLDNFGHLLLINDAVAVHVVHPVKEGEGGWV